MEDVNGNASGLAPVQAQLTVGDPGAPWSPRVERAAIEEVISGRALAVVEVALEDDDDDDGGGATPPLEGLLGRGAQLSLARADGGGTQRRFCGVVRAVERAWGAAAEGAQRLRLRIEPAFTRLDEQRLTRPFVGMSATEILRAVLSAHLAPVEGRGFELRLADGARPLRDLCVQYDETTYDFCRRLMAEEGLAHLFDHQGAVERLVLVEGARFDRGGAPLTMAPGARPAPDVESVYRLARWHTPGPAAPTDVLTGTSDVVALAAGRTHAFDGQEILLTAVRHRVDLREDPPAGGARVHYENTFRAVPAQAGFRPAPLSKPLALDDWAVVVSANEHDPIDADPQGRVCVAFIYDRREGVAAHDRSPPVQVSQAWAGDGYGVQVLPRAGMLARIEYAGGDPDRPVVAACFPTGANVLPAPPPDEKTRLTVRTHGLRGDPDDPGDRHRNELALDDAAGKEEVWMRAGRDHVRKVLHDEQVAIEHDEGRIVGGRQVLEVRGRRTKLVGGGEALSIAGSRRLEVAGDELRKVAADGAGAGGGDALAVDGRSETRVDGNRTTGVEGAARARFEGGRTTSVAGDATRRATGVGSAASDDELRVTQGASALSLTARRAHVSPERQLVLMNAGGTAVLDGQAAAGHLMLQRLTLICGSSQLVIGDGKVLAHAPSVVARGAAGAIALSAGGATISGQHVTSAATVLNEIKGLPVIFSATPNGNAS